MAILGIGVDTTRISRFEAMCQKFGEAASCAKILSRQEQALRLKPPLAVTLAKRFAAKEALAKALGCGLRRPVHLQEISIVSNNLGQPHFQFGPLLAHYLTQKNAGSVHLSLSDEGDFVSAFVVVEQKLIEQRGGA